MEEDRPEKGAVRALWLDQVEQAAQRIPNPSEPWYLTLSGAQGRDIQLLVEAGLINLTEVRSIAENDQGKVVAVEQRSQAILSLQRKFPGLKVRQAPFQELIRGEGLFAWPQGEDETLCRAAVVNLDLNGPLAAKLTNGQVTFPVIAWVKKLCQIHGRLPRRNWILCLTMNADIDWPPPANRWIRDFLRENLGREQVFETHCQAFFGSPLYHVVIQDPPPEYGRLTREEKQKLLMAIVPKAVAQVVHPDGWRVTVLWNLLYGVEDHAPMVTWGMSLEWDAQAAATPDAAYRDALRQVLAAPGRVSPEGTIEGNAA